jgi:hypothetical protein
MRHLLPLLLALAPLSGCGLDEDASPIGEPCVSTFDCPEAFECVAAESANASRVCMPLE